MVLQGRAGASALAAALIGGFVAFAPAAHASVVSSSSVAACYDTAHSYSKPDGNQYYPTPGSHLTTTSACSDINIQPKTDRYVAVCFSPSSGSDYCQSSYTLAHAGQWNTIATDVVDGTKFYFEFRSTALSNGSWAA